MAHLFGGRGDIALVPQDHGKHLHGFGVYHLSVEPQRFASALLGRIQVVKVQVGHCVKEVSQGELDGIQTQSLA